jgi:hypothetical protein
VASQEVEKVRDTTTFLLLSCDVTVGLEVAKSAPWPRVLPGLRPPRSGLGLLYIYQCHLRLRLTCFIICRMPGSTLGRRPGCGLRKPRNYRRSRHHILSFACTELTWPPGKFRRCKMSHPISCVHEDDVTSQEVYKIRDITTYVASQEVQKIPPCPVKQNGIK